MSPTNAGLSVLRSHRRGEVRFVSRGVVAVFSPWNAPLAEPLTLVFEALLAGNAVVWKPSSLAVLPALRAREIAVREGLPADLLAVVVGERDAGDALIDGGVDLAVTLGSKDAARRVATRCARALADDGVGGPFAYGFTESADRASAMADGLRASVVLHDDVFAAEVAVLAAARAGRDPRAAHGVRAATGWWAAAPTCSGRLDRRAAPTAVARTGSSACETPWKLSERSTRVSVAPMNTVKRCGLLAAGAWLVVGATGCRPAVPAELRYRVLLAGGGDLGGAVVTRQGAPIGSISAAGDVEFTTPSSARPSTLGLSLALSTPCGTRQVTLDLELTPDADSDRRIAEAMAQERVVLLRARLPAGAGTASAVVLLDRGGDAREVRVGEAVIAAPRRATLFVGDCAPSAPVRVGGEVIGTWHVGSAATFVSVEPVCHRLTTLGYGDAVTGQPQVFRQRVRALREVPEHVLQAAPRSVQGGRHEGARYVRELLRTECPAGPRPAEAAASAMAAGGCLQAMPALRRAVDDDQDDIASAVQFAVCAARNVEREGVEIAQGSLAVHPEARERFVQAFREAGLTGPAGAL